MTTKTTFQTFQLFTLNNRYPNQQPTHKHFVHNLFMEKHISRMLTSILSIYFIIIYIYSYSLKVQHNKFNERKIQSVHFPKTSNLKILRRCSCLRNGTKHSIQYTARIRWHFIHGIFLYPFYVHLSTSTFSHVISNVGFGEMFHHHHPTPTNPAVMPL